MQINLHFHPHAFASLEEAFDPAANTRYAARFLTELHATRGDWTRAAANYHSNTPELAEGYRARVLAAWPEEQRRAHTLRDDVANAWAQTWRGPTPPGGSGGMPVAAVAGSAHGGTLAAAAAGRGGGLASVVLSPDNRSARGVQVIPLPGGGAAAAGGGMTGRGLDAYRSAPIAVAGRPMQVAQIAEAPTRR